MNNNALIGATGFVGGTLLRQAGFAAQYRSTDIARISGREFDLVVCAAAPAQKWIANRDPAADLRNIESLIDRLRSVRCGTFVLVSTVDVFASPLDVDEESEVQEAGLHAYGLHRRLLEKFVQDHFERHLVIRLPGLVGPGLRKNVVYDFLNDNNLHLVDSRGVFQFYPMVNLWYDIEIALAAQLRLLHLTAEPISVGDVAAQGFGRVFDQPLPGTPARYDMRTRHAALFGGNGGYQYDARSTIQALRAYAQSEPRAAKPAGTAA